MAKAQTLQAGAGVRAKIIDSASSDVSRLRMVADRLKANPEEARRLTVKAGIYTENGNLKKVYRG